MASTAGAFMFIQDVGSPEDERLYNGSKVYIYGAKITESFNVNNGTSAKNTNDTSITTADLVDGGVSANYNRRLGNVSFGSLENPKWVIEGGWNYDEISTMFPTVGSERILTPYKLKRFATSGRPFIIWDSELIQNYALGETEYYKEAVSSFYYYTGSGPQVVIDGYSTSRDVKTNTIKFTITLIEDKED